MKTILLFGFTLIIGSTVFAQHIRIFQGNSSTNSNWVNPRLQNDSPFLCMNQYVGTSVPEEVQISSQPGNEVNNQGKSVSKPVHPKTTWLNRKMSPKAINCPNREFPIEEMMKPY